MVNPNDVFPRRNLPGDSEEWGRNVEDRIRSVEYATLGQKQGLSGVNRTSASTSQELSRQIVQLRGLYENLDALFRAIPKVRQASNSVSGFGMSPGWVNLITSTITVPEGSAQAVLQVNASGLLVSTTTTSLITSYSRVVIDGSASAEGPNPWYPGNGDFRSIMVPSGARTFNVTPGQSITVQFQALADDSTSYGYNSSSYAVLSTIATFTG